MKKAFEFVKTHKKEVILFGSGFILCVAIVMVTSMYNTYKENKIKFVGTLFSYRKIKYDSENNAIAYYPARTTGPYSLAKIEHDKLSQEVSGYASRDNIKDLKTNSIKF